MYHMATPHFCVEIIRRRRRRRRLRLRRCPVLIPGSGRMAFLLLLLKALQLRGSFGLLNEFFPFGPVSDAVLPVGYSQVCYITSCGFCSGQNVLGTDFSSVTFYYPLPPQLSYHRPVLVPVPPHVVYKGIVIDYTCVLSSQHNSFLLYRPVEMWWHTRRNHISSFGETDESI